MKKLSVKYRNGTTTIRNLHGLSAAMLRQILETVQTELSQIAGEYDWRLDGESGDYRILAHYCGGTWTDGSGKTPAEAIKSFYLLRNLLVDEYGVEI